MHVCMTDFIHISYELKINFISKHEITYLMYTCMHACRLATAPLATTSSNKPPARSQINHQQNASRFSLLVTENITLK